MLAFVHIQKTAGTTVNWMLRSSFGLRHCDVESWRSRFTPLSADDLKLLRKFYPHLASIAGHRVMPYIDLGEVCPQIQYFTLLRDPIKRSASEYQYLLHRQHENPPPSLEDFIQRDNVRNVQTRRLAGKTDVDVAIRMIQNQSIFVGLTDYFDESMLLLKSLVANDLNIAYRPMNVIRTNSIAKGLLASEHARQMLAEANQADLELYAYVKQELYPFYQREYGDSFEEDVASYRQNRGGLKQFNVILNRLHRNLVYKPALKLYRLRASRGSQ